MGTDQLANNDGAKSDGAPALAAVTLYEFSLSHYNEKARWALDYKGIPYHSEPVLPGLHFGKNQEIIGPDRDTRAATSYRSRFRVREHRQFRRRADDLSRASPVPNRRQDIWSGTGSRLPT